MHFESEVNINFYWGLFFLNWSSNKLSVELYARQRVKRFYLRFRYKNIKSYFFKVNSPHKLNSFLVPMTDRNVSHAILDTSFLFINSDIFVSKRHTRKFNYLINNYVIMSSACTALDSSLHLAAPIYTATKLEQWNKRIKLKILGT